MRFITIIFISCLTISCNKDPDFPPDIEIKDSVELKNSEVYLNGEIMEYVPELFQDTVNNQLLLNFVFDPDLSVTNILGFGALSVEVGNYILHTDRILYKGAKTIFSQTINGEFDGWQFELVQPEEGFFNISELNENDQTIQGTFKVLFQLVDKNGVGDSKLPEHIKFQGVFHDNYIRG